MVWRNAGGRCRCGHGINALVHYLIKSSAWLLKSGWPEHASRTTQSCLWAIPSHPQIIAMLLHNYFVAPIVSADSSRPRAASGPVIDLWPGACLFVAVPVEQIQLVQAEAERVGAIRDPGLSRPEPSQVILERREVGRGGDASASAILVPAPHKYTDEMYIGI